MRLVFWKAEIQARTSVPLSEHADPAAPAQVRILHGAFHLTVKSGRFGIWENREEIIFCCAVMRSSADSSSGGGGGGSGGNANGDGGAGGCCGSVSSDSGGGGDLSALGINDNALILPPSVLARVSACLSPEEPSLPLLLAQFDAASDPWTQRYPQSGGFVIHLLPPAPPRPRDFGKEHAAFIVKARRAARNAVRGTRSVMTHGRGSTWSIERGRAVLPRPLRTPRLSLCDAPRQVCSTAANKRCEAAWRSLCPRTFSCDVGMAHIQRNAISGCCCVLFFARRREEGQALWPPCWASLVMVFF